VFYRFGWKPKYIMAFYARKNKTLRPDRRVDNTKLGDTFGYSTHGSKTHFWWFPSTFGTRSLMSKMKRGEKLIFFKHFDPTTKSVTFLGYLAVNADYIIDTILPEVKSMATNYMKNIFTPLTPVNFYEEIKPYRIDVIQGYLTLNEAELRSGDILYVQEIPIDVKQIVKKHFKFSHRKVIQDVMQQPSKIDYEDPI